LLDGLVFGRRVVCAIVEGKTSAEPTGAMTGVLTHTLTDRVDTVRASADPVVLGADRPASAAALRGALQRTMSSDCGVARDPEGLRRAAAEIDELAARAAGLPGREAASYEVLNLLRVSRAIVAAASAREESRGAHTRTDIPHPDDRWLGRLVIDRDAPPRFVPLASLVVREQA